MPYPVLTKTDAKRALIAYGSGEPFELTPITKDLGDNCDWEEIADKLHNTLEKLKKKFPGKSKKREFEVPAGIEIHKALPDHHPATADPVFWLWLVITRFMELVKWRYGKDADKANFGLGSANENFLFRLWQRADIGFEPETHSYELAELGDIDLWRSHIFRQSYAMNRSFTAALVRFQCPDGPTGKNRLNTKDIRALVKHLCKAQSNLVFETLDEAESAQYIEQEWDKIKD